MKVRLNSRRIFIDSQITKVLGRGYGQTPNVKPAMIDDSIQIHELGLYRTKHRPLIQCNLADLPSKTSHTTCRPTLLKLTLRSHTRSNTSV